MTREFFNPTNPSTAMKEALALILVLLLVSVALNVYQGMQAKEAQTQRLSENRANQEEISLNQAMAAKARSVADSLLSKISADRAETDRVLKAKEMRLAAMSDKLSKLRVPVQITIDTMATLGAFVRAYDSLSMAKDSVIMEMKLRHGAEIVDLKGVIKANGEEILAKANESEAWRQTAMAAQEDLTKEKRKVKGWKIVGGILSAGILYMAIKE